MSESSIRLGRVPPAAVADLLAAVDACAGRPLMAQALVDVDIAVAQARSFKLDVSFALTPDAAEGARFSLNDKGEPEAFRRRLVGHAEALGIDAALLAAQLRISPPGEVQTTLAVKWAPTRPPRVTVYFEELTRSPRAEAIRRACFALGGVDMPPPPPGLDLVAACVDHSAGRAVAVKDYHLLTERAGTPPVALPAAVEPFRAPFGWHPVNGTRRFLLATRYAAGGGPIGSKLLWMSEVHRHETVGWAWAEVDRIRAAMRLPESRVGRALDALRAAWAHAPGTFLYPDLVSLDVDADGTPQGLVVYVSIR